MLVVSAFVIVGYFWWQGQQPQKSPGSTFTPNTTSSYTSDWMVYTNEVFNLTFKYPKDWKLEIPPLANLHSDNNTLLQINLTNPTFDKNKLLDPMENAANPSDPDSESYAITIIVWDNKQRESIDEKLTEVDKFFQNTVQFKDPHELPYTPDIKRPYRRYIENASGQELYQFDYASGDYIYLITGGLRDSRAGYRFDQIMSTFRFID